MNRKIFFLFFVLVIFAGGALRAQALYDTSSITQQQTGERQGAQFIDEDGDGICDERTEGLGFKKSTLKQKRAYGKNQLTPGGTGQGSQSPTPQGKSSQYRRGKQ